MNVQKTTVFLLVAIAFNACAQKKNVYNSPAGYNLNNPVEYKMPESLLEISGIDFFNGDPGTLYAEQDEDGKIFYLHPGDKKARHLDFGKHGDYEDIAICNDYMSVLRSDGKLFIIPFSEVKNRNISTVKKWDDLLPKGEYEAMYADVKTNRLFVLCKDCNDDKSSKEVSGYTFQLNKNGEITPVRNFKLNVAAIAKFAGEKGMKFKPSAIAKNEGTNEWYILSSINKMLVIADEQWGIKQVYKLNPSLFNQPEGIAFDKENALYISNEGDETQMGNVLKFPHSPGN